jgi:hypothetical protein
VVKEMKKKEFYRQQRQQAAGSRQHALMREEAGRKPFVGSMLCGRAAGKKSARR